MSTVHGVVILAQQRYEAPLIQAIQRHGETLAIVRRCADLAEVIAASTARESRIWQSSMVPTPT